MLLSIQITTLNYHKTGKKPDKLYHQEIKISSNFTVEPALAATSTSIDNYSSYKIVCVENISDIVKVNYNKTDLFT